MLRLTYAPRPPLDAFVDVLWYCNDSPPHSRERVLPNGTTELVFNLREDEFRIYDPLDRDRFARYSGAMVSGTYDRFFVIDPAQHASIIGVHFKPGGAFPFFVPPAKELVSRHVDLEALWGFRARELRERLCLAATPSDQFRLLEEALLAQLVRPLARHPAVAMALAECEKRNVALKVRDLARHVGLSERRFIQVFSAEVGLTPKLFSRIQRFQRARMLAQQARPDGWAGLAATCGYYDQAHMIGDFVTISGLSPLNYLRQRSEEVLPTCR